MTTIPWRDRVAAVNSGLLTALFFLLPTQIAPAYVLTTVMLVLWLVEGRFAEKWRVLLPNPVFWLCQALFWWFAISLLWTENRAAGIDMVMRYLFFALSAVYFTVARPEHAMRYLIAFGAGVAMCEVLAVYNWLQLHLYPHWPAGIRAQKEATETAPFVDRILFAPMLAFAGYVAAWRATRACGRTRIAWLALFALTVVVLGISASRTGAVAFMLLMVLWAVQAFPGRRMLALGGSCAVLCASAASLVLLSDQVTRARFAEAVMEFRQLDSGVNLSVPLRANLAVNTLHIIAEHPWLGVGAGDWKSAYADMNARRTPAWNTPRNPHNQLLFATVLTGPIGGALVVALWFVPPWLHRHRRDGLGGLRAGLALLFAAICMAESYFWRSNTGLMFVIFCAMLYGPRHDDARVTSPAQTPRPLA